MNSPFPVNAVLTFQVPTGERRIDELGNPEAITQTLVVTAYVKEKTGLKRPPTETDRASEAQTLKIKGRCIEPQSLPLTLLAGAKATAKIGDLEGDFYLEPCLQSPFTEVTDALGAKLQGTFEVRVVYGARG